MVSFSRRSSCQCQHILFLLDTENYSQDTCMGTVCSFSCCKAPWQTISTRAAKYEILRLDRLFWIFFLAFYLAKSLHPYPPVHQAFPGTCSSDAGDRRSSVDGLVPRASHTPPRAATQASLKRENCLGSSHLLRMENRKGTTS